MAVDILINGYIYVAFEKKPEGQRCGGVVSNGFSHIHCKTALTAMGNDHTVQKLSLYPAHIRSVSQGNNSGTSMN
jgi:hypothetical protein